MLTTTFQVELPYAKSVRSSATLAYSLQPSANAQARFQGRLVATPLLDLDQYRCRAVIDFLDLRVELKRSTQFRFVQRSIIEVTGATPYVEVMDPGAGGESSVFTIRFQEPVLGEVELCVLELGRVFGLVTEPTVECLEVSVDFTPRAPSELLRHKMVGLLSRHLYPDMDFLSERVDRPRFNAGRGTEFLVYDGIIPGGLDPMRWPDKDRAVPVDATFYVGRKSGDIQWKVMDKVLDQQNRRTGTRLELPEAEKRCRVEVTLSSRELRANQITTLGTLRNFKFARLQGSYFQFVLPTFAVSFPGIVPAVGAYFENNRKARFKNAGVVGLVIHDQATREFRRSKRKEVKASLKIMKKKVVSPTKRGAGPMGSYAKYSELCGRVSSALEKLSLRERR